MNIEDINRKHFVETDMYYRVGFGLSSKLLKYQNGIFHIEIVIGKKWEKSHNATASEIAHGWKNNHFELSKAIGCKVYIIDTKSFPYKRSLIHQGAKPGYDAKKGILFRSSYLN